jgi:glycerol-3-phosphate dehydrogenase (NAD(P)+)
VAVVGTGAWGTTLALVAARAGRAVALWFRDPDAARLCAATRRNPRAPLGVPLPPAVGPTADLAHACADASVIVVAVPSRAMRENARRLAPHVGGAVVVSATKGLERGSLRRMTEVIDEEFAAAGVSAPVCALSGPNLAAEVARGQPAVTVVAGRDRAAAARARDLLMGPGFRCYTNTDVVGVEMGGALKNVIAIGAGIGDGLAAGDNAKAAFLTRGIAEIARLGVAVGAEPLTFAGLSGLGDLVATCASPLSRNNRLGRALAAGRSLAEAEASLGQVAEGVPTTEAAYALGRRLGVELPITEQLHAVLFGGKAPEAAIAEMMRREPKDEFAGFGRPDGEVTIIG